MIDFLLNLASKFEIVLFSSEKESYSNELVKHMFAYANKEGYDLSSSISHVLNKSQCSTNSRGHEIKNLELFIGKEARRKLSNCLIISHNIFEFQKHLSNGIPVPKCTEEAKDNTLLDLSQYLLKYFGEECPGFDVRTVIKKDFGLEEIIDGLQHIPVFKSTLTLAPQVP
jgi:TFIIF-interacting CTD phosphatase-like protein